MVQTVCLDENEHSVSMLRGMKEMKHEQDLCDFIIKVKGDEYHVHKVVLSSGSAYFKAMFKHDTVESRDARVLMKDVDSECVKSCIDFLYSGNFVIPDGKIGQLLHVAIMFQLDKIKNAISDILEKSLSEENFYETRKVAGIYNLQDVSKKCKAFYEENFVTISSQPGFVNEKKSHIIKILKSKNMKLSEEEKLTVSLRWVGKNLGKKENLFELIKVINLKCVKPEFLSDILANNPVISNDFRLYKLINAPLLAPLLPCTGSENAKKQSISTQNDDINRKLIILFDKEFDCLHSFDPCTTTNELSGFHKEHFRQIGLMFTAVSMDTYIYILCSDKSVHRLNFKDKDSKWERMKDMMCERGNNPPVVSLSGSLFVIGRGPGWSVEPTKFVEKFTPSADQWLRLVDKPEATSYATLVTLNDSIFCIGGCIKGKVNKSFCRFTPSSSEWVDLEPVPSARKSCGAVAIDDRIFVMGGLGYLGDEQSNDLECYNVVTKQWTILSSIGECHCHCTAHYCNGWIFLVKDGFGKIRGTIHKYDIENDKWYEVKLENGEWYGFYKSVTVELELG